MMDDDYIPFWKGFLLFILIPLVIVSIIWVICNALGIQLVYVVMALVIGLSAVALVRKVLKK
jgi:hypothetical protein